MKKRILIADDEPDMLEIEEATLARTGREIITTGDGETTIEAIKTGKFNLIILDILMPKPGGIEIVRWIRKNKQAKRIPIIILSAMSQEYTREKAFNLGVDEFITKPVDLDLLDRIVTKYLID